MSCTRFQPIVPHPSVLPRELDPPRKDHPGSAVPPVAAPRLRLLSIPSFSAIVRAVLIGFGLVALIVITLGVAVNDFSSCSCGGSPTDAARLFTQVAVETPLVAFRIHNGRYPSTAEGLVALAQAPRGLEASWHGPYIESDYRKLLDPWGHLYQYRSPGTHNPNGYDIWSLGPDGVSGTADDIGNWPPRDS